MTAIINSWQVRTGTSIDDVVKLQDVGGGTPGLPSVDISQAVSINADAIASGTIPNGRITQTNVTQHEGALTVSFTQMSDNISDSQVPQSSVTQHEGALTVSFTQMSDNISDSQVPQSSVTQHEGALTVGLSQLASGGASDGQTLQWSSTNSQYEPKDAGIPSGSRIVFYQSSAPVGWTQDTNVNDRVLRAVSGSGGGTGGDWTISGIGQGNLSVDGHTLTISEMPIHDHGGGNHTHRINTTDIDSSTGYVHSSGGGTLDTAFTDSSGDIINNEGKGEAHSHGLSGSPDHDGNWRPSYIDVIVAVKD